MRSGRSRPSYNEPQNRATRESGSNVIDDPVTSRYFDALSIVTSGPLFSRDRIRAMVDVNLGRLAR